MVRYTIIINKTKPPQEGIAYEKVQTSNHSTRPEVVNKKIRIGDWEIDTVISEQKKGAVLVTMVDKKSKFSLIA